jgi:hypothetical protein
MHYFLDHDINLNFNIQQCDISSIRLHANRNLECEDDVIILEIEIDHIY